MNLRPNLLRLLAILLHRQTPSLPTPEASPSTIPDPRQTQVMPERRAHPRRYGDPVEVHLRTQDDKTPPCGSSGWVRDRSLGGIGLAVEKPLEPGTALKVRPVFVFDDSFWVQVVVRHCHPQGHRWIVGCQFVEALPREVMLLFR